LLPPDPSSFPWPEFSPGSCLICLPYTPPQATHCRLKAPQSPALFYRTSNSYVCLKAMYPSLLSNWLPSQSQAASKLVELSAASHVTGWAKACASLSHASPRQYHLPSSEGYHGLQGAIAAIYALVLKRRQNQIASSILLFLLCRRCFAGPTLFLPIMPALATRTRR
jgi:ribosomal protein L40E